MSQESRGLRDCTSYYMEKFMIDLTVQQIDNVAGGNPLLALIAVAGFFSMGGYEASVEFTSGAIEGFMEAR